MFLAGLGENNPVIAPLSNLTINICPNPKSYDPDLSLMGPIAVTTEHGRREGCHRWIGCICWPGSRRGPFCRRGIRRAGWVGRICRQRCQSWISGWGWIRSRRRQRSLSWIRSAGRIRRARGRSRGRGVGCIRGRSRRRWMWGVRCHRFRCGYRYQQALDLGLNCGGNVRCWGRVLNRREERE